MMNIFRIFGMGEDKLLAKGYHAPGIVTKVDRCWWYSTKTKPVRLYISSHNTAYPHIITFSYSVDKLSYEGKRFIWIRNRCPQKGEVIDVYYDPNNPKKYAFCAFGSGISSISW